MANYKDAMTYAASQEGATNRLLARFGPLNRRFAEKLVRYHRNARHSGSTTRQVASALLKWDAWRPAQAFDRQTPDDLEAFFAYLGDQKKPNGRPLLGDRMLEQVSIRVRECLMDILDVKELPRSWDRATKVAPGSKKPAGRVITEEEFRAVLKVAAREPRVSTLQRGVMRVAMLWALWDNSFRARELLSVNVGDWKREDAHGAVVTLREKDRREMGLKTGGGQVYATESVGAIEAWLACHPAGTDPRAPLFIGERDRTGYRRMGYGQFNKMIRRLGDEAGINATTSTEDPMSAHDLRHTSLTQKGRNNWGDEKLRIHARWGPGSKMTSYYLHLGIDDLRKQARRDAGVDALGYKELMDAGDELGALAELLERAMARRRKAHASPGAAPTR